MTCALVLSVANEPVHAATLEAPMRNFEVRLVGTVRNVDRHARLVIVAYAPLETAPGGVRPVFVAERRAIAALHVGEPISAIADTRHSPWTVRDVRVLR